MTGIFTDEKWDLLKECNITKLRQMAKEKNVKVESQGIFRSKVNKDDYVSCLYDSSKISKAYIKRVLKGEKSEATGKVRVGKKISLNTVSNAVRKDYKISRIHDTEAEFERDFKNWCRGRFGADNVTTQYSVGKTRIDVVVGGVGIELKFPKTARALMTLRGQTDVYKKHFGKDLMILLISPRIDPSVVFEFKRDMKSKGVKVVEKR
ncbi:MAG: hypothetical protein KAW09_05365 [Thermoplasmata archaeon]|nr:hypothetical protein [Thermoplasmata archaeon]